MNMQNKPGWLGRRWPTWAFAAVFVGSIIVLALQQMEIRDLRSSLHTLSQGMRVEEVGSGASVARPAAPGTTDDPATRGQRELDRLKETSSRLASEIGQLEKMRADNKTLQSQLASPPVAALTPEETEALAQARERAMRIGCVNNLKQFGLAVKMWELDHGDVFPPDIVS